MNAALIGLPLWLVCSWLVKPPGLVRQSARACHPAAGGHLGGANGRAVLFGFVALALATIVITEAHVALYYLFLRVDFQQRGSRAP